MVVGLLSEIKSRSRQDRWDQEKRRKRIEEGYEACFMKDIQQTGWKDGSIGRKDWLIDRLIDQGMGM